MKLKPGLALLVAVLGMALIAGAAALLGHAGPRRSSKPPVVPPPPTTTTAGSRDPAPLATYPTDHGASMPLTPGQIVSVSQVYVRNRSDHPLVLDRIVEFRTEHGGPDIVGVYAIAPWRAVPSRGYRVPAAGRPLPGAIVQPHEKVVLVIGVKATPGRHSFESVDVLYHSSAGSFSLRVPFALGICVPGNPDTCPIPKLPDEVGG